MDDFNQATNSRYARAENDLLDASGLLENNDAADLVTTTDNLLRINSTNHRAKCYDDYGEYDKMHDVINIVISSSLIVFGTLGNAVTYGVFRQRSYRKNIMSGMFRYLSVLDTICLWTVVLQVFLKSTHGYHPYNTISVSCLFFMVYVQIIISLANWMLVVITVARLIHLKFPHKSKTYCSHLHYSMFLICTHLCVIGVHVGQAFGIHGRLTEEDYQSGLPCMDFLTSKEVNPKREKLIYASTNFIGPAAVLLVCNVTVVRELHALERRRERLFNQTPKSSGGRSQHEVVISEIPTEQFSNNALHRPPSPEQFSNNALPRGRNLSSRDPSSERISNNAPLRNPSTEQFTNNTLPRNPSNEQFNNNILPRNPSNGQFNNNALHRSPSNGELSNNANSRDPSTEQFFNKPLGTSSSTNEDLTEPKYTYKTPEIGLKTRHVSRDKIYLTKTVLTCDGHKICVNKHETETDSKLDIAAAATDSCNCGSVDLNWNKTLSVVSELSKSTKASKSQANSGKSESNSKSPSPFFTGLAKSSSDHSSQTARSFPASYGRRMSRVSAKWTWLSDAELVFEEEEPTNCSSSHINKINNKTAAAPTTGLESKDASKRVMPAERTTNNLTKMLISASVVFMVFNTPFWAYYIIAEHFDPDDPPMGCSLTYMLADIVLLIRYANNSVNFVFYCAIGTGFRQEIHYWLRRGFCCCRRKE